MISPMTMQSPRNIQSGVLWRTHPRIVRITGTISHRYPHRRGPLTTLYLWMETEILDWVPGGSGFPSNGVGSVVALPAVKRRPLGVFWETVEVEVFDLSSRPRSASEELEARIKTGIQAKTSDRNPSTEFFPAILFFEVKENLLKSHAMQRIFGMWISHRSQRFRQAGGNSKELQSGKRSQAANEGEVSVRVNSGLEGRRLFLFLEGEIFCHGSRFSV